MRTRPISAILTELAWSIKDLLYGIKNTEKMIFILVYFRALKRKPVTCKSDVLFSLFSFSLTLSVFSFSSFIPTEKSRKIFLLSRKIFCKRKLSCTRLDFGETYCGNKTGNPERAIWAHLARSGSQSEHRTRLILPARGACHIIKCNTTKYYVVQLEASETANTIRSKA